MQNLRLPESLSCGCQQCSQVAGVDRIIASYGKCCGTLSKRLTDYV